MDKLQEIKEWYNRTSETYDKHKVEQNGIYMYHLVNESKRLFVEMITLKKIIDILERDNKK